MKLLWGLALCFLCLNNSDAKPQLKVSSPLTTRLLSPSVVKVNIYSDEERVSDFGSGFIVSADGYVATAQHLFDTKKISKVEVVFRSGESVPAKLYATDEFLDLALLKVETKTKLYPCSWQEKSQNVGASVTIYGHPFNLNFSEVHGFISAIDRSLSGSKILDNIPNEHYQQIRFLQIDGNLNPGLSGSPVFDQYGLVVGMSVLIPSTHGASTGIGFAVPSRFLQRSISDLIKYKKPRWNHLGIEIASSEEGLRVICSENNIFSPGDIITHFNNKKIHDLNDFMYEIKTLPVQTIIQLRILRGKTPITLSIKLCPQTS